MVFIAIINGAIREGWYGKYVSELQAHQISTVTGVLLFGVGAFGWAVRDRAARQQETARQEAARQAKFAEAINHALEESEDLCKRDNLTEALAAYVHAWTEARVGDPAPFVDGAPPSNPCRYSLEVLAPAKPVDLLARPPVDEPLEPVAIVSAIKPPLHLLDWVLEPLTAKTLLQNPAPENDVSPLYILVTYFRDTVLPVST